MTIFDERAEAVVPPIRAMVVSTNEFAGDALRVGDIVYLDLKDTDGTYKRKGIAGTWGWLEGDLPRGVPPEGVNYVRVHEDE